MNEKKHDPRGGVKDYTDPKTVNKGKKKHKAQQEDEIADLQAVLNLPQGRRVLWRILEHSKLLAHDMFTGNSTTFHNLGRRDEGLWLYTEIMEADPLRFMSMMMEQLGQDSTKLASMLNQLKEDENNG